MAIICGPVTETISFVSKSICGHLIKIYNIEPYYETIAVLINNQQIIPGIGNVNVRIDSQRVGIRLVSKNVSAGTATIIFTLETIEVPPPITETHYIEYDVSFLPSSFLGLISQNITTLSNTIGPFLPLPSNVSYTRSEYQNGKYRIYIKYTPVLGMDIPTGLSLLAATIAGILVFILLSRILIILGPWGLAGAAIVGVVAAAVTGYSIYEIATGLSLPGKSEVTPDKQIEIVRDFSAEVRKRCLELHPGCNTGNCSPTLMASYNKCIGAADLAQYANDEQQANTYDPTKYDQLKNTILDNDKCLAMGTCTTFDAAKDIDDRTSSVNENSKEKERETKCDPGYTYDKNKKECVKTGLSMLEMALLAGIGILGIMYISRGRQPTVIIERDKEGG